MICHVVGRLLRLPGSSALLDDVAQSLICGFRSEGEQRLVEDGWIIESRRAVEFGE